MPSSSTPLRRPAPPREEGGEDEELRLSIAAAFVEMDQDGGEDGEAFMGGLIADLEKAAATAPAPSR